MSIVGRPTLSPAMLLWEVTAIASRHGLPVDTSNPSACLHYAERLMQSLGLAVAAEPPAELLAAPADSTAVLPLVPDVPRPDGVDSLGAVMAMPLPPRRPIDGHSFSRGAHRPGAPRALRSVGE